MQSLHRIVERKMYLNSTLNEEYLEYPYHCFCEENPRFISKNLLHSLLSNEVSPYALENHDEILQAFRGFRIYTDLEAVQLYEVSNAYAYELALRTQRVKAMLHSATKDSSFIAHQSDEIWIDIKEALVFEHTRYNDNVSWSNDPWWNTTPRKTLPAIKVPSSKTDYLPINLNMYLPENELRELLKAYVSNLKQMRETKPIKDNEDNLYSKLASTVKLIRGKNKMPVGWHHFIDKIKKPNTKTLKLAECFFAYDMLELGFETENIASALENHRAMILAKLNFELIGKDEEVFTIEDAKLMLADIDPAKTITKWHKEISHLAKSGQYKNIVSSSNPGLLSTENYLTNTTPTIYYDLE